MCSYSKLPYANHCRLPAGSCVSNPHRTAPLLGTDPFGTTVAPIRFRICSAQEVTMGVHLKVIHGEEQGLLFSTDSSEFLIGRAESCHLRPQSRCVSRMHCGIFHDNDTTMIQDFGSRNGTFVNGQPLVAGRRELRAGDRVVLGPLELQVLDLTCANPLA